MTTSVTAGYGVGLSTSGDAEVLLTDRISKLGIGVLVAHGYGAGAAQWQPAPPASNPYGPVEKLAASGRTVLCGDMGGQNTFANSAFMAAMTAAYNRLTTTLGCAAKVGVLGWSMGGGAALAWAVANPAKVRAVYAISAATNYQTVHDLTFDGGSTYPYRTQLENDFGGSSSWFANSASVDPIRNAASYRSLPFPVRLIQAQDDTTLPYSVSTAFIAAVNDPNVKLTTLATGGHGPWATIDPTECVRVLA